MSRTYLVVGGSSGIGRNTVESLLAQGHEVLVASRTNPGDLDGWQEFDATDLDSLLGLPEVLDGLVYCPGSIHLKPFHRLTEDDYRQDWELNFLGAVRAIGQALPSLKQAERASIVLFSTVAVQTGLPFHASISGAKGAVEGLTRTLAAELAPKIRVNAIAPSLTDTPLAEQLLSSEEKAKAARERHPLKRVGSAVEMGAMVAFLLGQNSGFLTGQVIQVDGGISSLKML